MTQSMLVIDDNEDLCDFVSAAARILRWQCTTTTKAHDFLEKLTPDTTIVLLDLMMPEMDGIELLRLLGRQECHAGIVLMSAVDKRVLETADALARALGLFVVGHLHKPFQIADLEEMLSRPRPLPILPSSPSKSQGLIPNVDLRLAITRNEFVVHYQPQVDIVTGKIVGLEAFVRWQHPDGRLLHPEFFLARLEAMGWIDDLGWLVTRRALAESAQFADQDGDVPGISINTSVNSLLDLGFPDRLMTLAEKFSVPAEKITIELSEGGLLKELSKTLDVLTRLRMKGVQLSIDNFGTGNSVIHQLRHIPATELKIDRSFVRSMHDNDSDRIIVHKTIEMGHELGMFVVVEGVETEEQLTTLRLAGCDAAQGYFFSPPMPPAAMTQWLKNYRTSLPSYVSTF